MIVDDLDLRRALVKRLEVFGEAEKLAKELNVSPAYISNIKRGRTPPSQRLAKALGFEKVVMWKRI